MSFWRLCCVDKAADHNYTGSVTYLCFDVYFDEDQVQFTVTEFFFP